MFSYRMLGLIIIALLLALSTHTEAENKNKSMKMIITMISVNSIFRSILQAKRTNLDVHFSKKLHQFLEIRFSKEDLTRNNGPIVEKDRKEQLQAQRKASTLQYSKIALGILENSIGNL